MSGTFLTTETKSGLMDIYVSSPETQNKLPVIIVLQEAFGVNSHIRSICDRLAAEGFVVAAPELFHRIGRRIEIPYGERKLFMPYLSALTNDGIIEDVQDSIEFLSDLPTADTSNISTIGFCVGGFASALCGIRLDIKKMISFYGAGMVNPREGIALTPFVQEIHTMRGEGLFFFGGKDASIPHSDIHEIQSSLTKAQIPFEVVIYEYSDHGFFCEERKSYNQEDASAAWKKCLKFLKNE